MKQILVQLHDGDTVVPKMDGYVLECCGCGRRHKLVFHVTRAGRANHVAFTITRLRRKR